MKKIEKYKYLMIPNYNIYSVRLPRTMKSSFTFDLQTKENRFLQCIADYGTKVMMEGISKEDGLMELWNYYVWNHGAGPMCVGEKSPLILSRDFLHQSGCLAALAWAMEKVEFVKFEDLEAKEYAEWRDGITPFLFNEKNISMREFIDILWPVSVTN
jgi:hypothetical protein